MSPFTSGKYLVLLRNGWGYDILTNDDGKFQFDSEEEGRNHRSWFMEALKKYSIDHDYAADKLRNVLINLRIEIKQIS